MIRIRQINVAIDEDENELITKCAKKLKTNKENIEEYKIVKKSIDARDKQNIVFCYEVDIKAKNEDEILRKNKSKDIFEASNTQYVPVPNNTELTSFLNSAIVSLCDAVSF